jgi:hypothetical protein
VEPYLHSPYTPPWRSAQIKEAEMGLYSIPCSRVLPGKLIVAQLFKKYSALYGTCRFITVTGFSPIQFDPVHALIFQFAIFFYLGLPKL